ncbi:MAG: transporter permease, partial [Frankiales bacterium]|nr:transporter permease [Frankiales bacterium]
AVPGSVARPGATSGASAAPAAALPVAGGPSVAKGAPIKVGAIVTQTGAINFASAAQGAKAWFDKVNAAGGVNGRRIELDLRDDQLDPARGRQQAQQMLAGGVFAFAAWNAPLTENGIVPFLEQNRVPLIGAYGQQAEYHSPYSWIMSASYGHYGFQMGSWLAEQGVKEPGVIFITNNSKAADDGLVNGFKAGFKTKGITLDSGNVAVVDPTKASYDDTITGFKLGGVDGMATVLDQTAYNRLEQAQARQAYRPQHVAVPLVLDPTVKLPRAADGTFVATDFEFVQGGPAPVQEYERTVRAAYGAKAQINYIGQQGWLNAVVFTEAVKRMGDDISRTNLLRVMATLPPTTGGFTSALRFGPYAGDTRDLNRCLKIGKLIGGKVTRLTDWRCDEQTF